MVRRLMLVIALLPLFQMMAMAQDDTLKESSFKRLSISESRKLMKQEDNKLYVFTKGDKFIGANLSFGGKTAENDYLMANIDLPDSKKRNVDLSFVAGYFLTSRTSTGLRGRYSYSMSDQLLVADFLGVAFNADEYRTQSMATGFEIHAFIRNYVPIGSSKKFYFFSETSFYYGQRTSYTRAISDPGKPNERIRKIWSDYYTFGLGISPGITYFASRCSAFEFQLGTTGFEFVRKEHLTDDYKKGASNQFTFRDGLNLLKVQFGFTYYFN